MSIVRPPLLLVGHGSRDPAGVAVTRRLAARVRHRLDGAPVRLAFVDVRPPTVAQVVPGLLPPALSASSRAVLVPLFLAAGYHVRHDLPAQLAATGLADQVLVTSALGPDPLLVDAAADRLRGAGWRPGDIALLVSAGSSDPRARAEVGTAAGRLGHRLGCEVRIGYLASGSPLVSDLVNQLRSSGRRVAVASWLLAPGAFQRRLHACGADVVSDPLGAHRGVCDAVLTRYRAAVAAQRAAA